MVTILVCFFLILLGFGFIQNLEHDRQLQNLDNAQKKAYYLARSGIEYYCFNNLPGRDISQVPGLSGPGPITVKVTETESFELVIAPSGGCQSKGIVRRSDGVVVAERIINLSATPGPSLPVPQDLTEPGL